MRKQKNKPESAQSLKTGRKTVPKSISLLPSDLQMFETIRRKYLAKALTTEGAGTTLRDNEIVRAGLLALLEVLSDTKLVDIVMRMNRSKLGRPSEDAAEADE
jgi:hypothetical protein